MVDLTGTKLETADTAKENLQPIGTSLSERRLFAIVTRNRARRPALGSPRLLKCV